MKLPPARKTAAIITAISLPIALIVLSIWSIPVYAVSARWVLVGLAIAAVSIWLLQELAPKMPFSEQVQIFSALFTASAILIAAGIYFLERRDQARLAFGLQANVIRPSPGKAPADQVLLSIRIPIENRGQRAVTIQCMGIDVLTLPPNAPLQRSTSIPEEMRLHPLRESIPYDTAATRNCVRADERRKKVRPGSFRPLFMWKGLMLEPNEEDDRHFEIPVSCQFPFVRIIWKMRINPDDWLSYESKTMVSLWDACHGESGSSLSVVAPSIQADANRASSSAAQP